MREMPKFSLVLEATNVAAPANKGAAKFFIFFLPFLVARFV